MAPWAARAACAPRSWTAWRSACPTAASMPRSRCSGSSCSRVLKPCGRAAIVTWTETERYELAARLLGAVAAVRGPQPPPAALPAQLRFRDEPALRRLLGDAGLTVEAIIRVEERWRMPSSRWLAD